MIHLLIEHGPTLVAGALITILVQESLKVRRKKRLTIEAARLPTFRLTVKDGTLEARVFGNYSLLNLSDLPVNVIHYNFLLYNVASRALQFNLGRSNVPLEKWFEEIVIPPSAEVALVEQDEWLIGADRCWVKKLPTFLWFEVLEHARIGSRKVLRYRARLYIVSYWSRESREAMYRVTRIEFPARWARLLALPGKLVHRRRGREI